MGDQRQPIDDYTQAGTESKDAEVSVLWQIPLPETVKGNLSFRHSRKSPKH